MNYGQLKTAIANHLHRTDLTALIPDFVQYAESAISNEPTTNNPDVLQGIRVRAQNIRATQSIVNQYEAIPTDMMSIRDMQLNSAPVISLDYLSPQDLTRKFPAGTAGTPKFYTIHGDEFQFAPTPDTTYTLEISYHARFTTLSADSDTNWLLTNHPLVYVYAACIAGSSYIESDPVKFINLYRTLANGINETENSAQYGSELVARPKTATP